MGKLIVSEFVSIDGVFQDPGGTGEIDRGAWSFKDPPGPEFDKFKLDELLAADVQLLGRVTYEAFAAVWPSMTDEDGFADKMNSMPKYVVSRSLENPTWSNTIVINDKIAERVGKLKQDVAGDILVGGSGQLVPHAARRKPRRRVAAHDVPGDRRTRQASLWRAAPAREPHPDRGETDRHQGCHRPDLPTDRKIVPLDLRGARTWYDEQGAGEAMCEGGGHASATLIQRM